MATLSLDKASKCDITYRKNDSCTFNISAQDGSGTDFNFTGYSAKLQIKDGLSNSVLATFSVGSGITLSTGLIAINLGQLALSKQELIYDLQLTSSGGVVSTWLYGRLVEVEDVTT